MAIGQKAQLTPAQRGRICGRRDAGQTPFEIYKDTGIPLRTIERTLAREKLYPNLKNLPHGAKQKTTKRDDRRLCRGALKDRKQTLEQLRADTIPQISRRTIQRRLKEVYIRKWLSKKRPPLTPELATRRLQWAIEHKNWTLEQ